MNFLETLRALPLQRQLMLGLAVAAAVGGIALMTVGGGGGQKALLYSGLEPASIGEVLNELDQLGIDYELRGEAIFVDESARDSVRFALARDGLPRQSVQGYELLDSVNGFSVTSEMYNAAYWRAKEGELTRTILAIPGVDSARVHIGTDLRSGFSRQQASRTASVTISTTRNIGMQQAEAIQYLVALAVPGLGADEVAVIDVRNGILAGPGDRGASLQDMVETGDRATQLEASILRLLETRVGTGNVQVSAIVDVERNIERVSSVAFDPDSRVLRSRTRADNSETREGGSPGLTVASNLPEGAGGAATSTSNATTSSESVTYEINETRREIERLPGSVQRISIGVVVNQNSLGIDPEAVDAATQIAEISQDLQQLVMSAAGLDLQRGDTLTLELMPFREVVVDDMIRAPSVMDQFIEHHAWSAAQLAILAVVILALGFGVIRPILSPARNLALDGEGSDETLTEVPAAGPPAESDPIDLLSDFTSARQDDAARLLKDWLGNGRADPDYKASVNE